MKIPNITWAQNQKKIFINIILEPNKNNIINITANNIEFKQDEYEFNIELNNEINTDNYIINKNKIFELDINKIIPNFWSSLLKDSNLLKNNIKIDWSRWEDNDDDDDILSINSSEEDNESKKSELEINDKSKD